ncbi:hypothetical protein HYALB_00003409 [Hymenoscyphus albidus]|uniref:Uncharacterized protein n=1 Tax=Hymenoscyphus albidus TaxID=595503 RepID=A0A9N9L8W8_9HELO|nr:hypothetical protein HYALB_00003409 [Hymenoscyphus albidus]
MQIAAILTTMAYLATTVLAETAYTQDTGYGLPEGANPCSKHVYCGSVTESPPGGLFRTKRTDCTRVEAIGAAPGGGFPCTSPGNTKESGLVYCCS